MRAHHARDLSHRDMDRFRGAVVMWVGEGGLERCFRSLGAARGGRGVDEAHPMTWRWAFSGLAGTRGVAFRAHILEA